MAAQSWSTEQLTEAEQFPFWGQIVREAFVPVDIRRPMAGPFPSRVVGRRVGALGVSRIDSQTQTVRRTREQVRSGGGEFFFLNLPLSRGASARQDDQLAQLAPGDFTLVDGTRPFELDFACCFSQISLTLPHDLLMPRLSILERATAIRISGTHGVGAVASGAIRGLASGEMASDSAATRSLVQHVSDLIALAIGAAAPQLPSSMRTLLAQAARDEVERSLSDRRLSRALVAERLSISTRYLDQLFARDGTSFGRWMLERRLERSHRELVGAAHLSRSVTDIARDAGFDDPSYFARAFKARYGASPTEARRAARALLPTAGAAPL